MTNHYSGSESNMTAEDCWICNICGQLNSSNEDICSECGSFKEETSYDALIFFLGGIVAFGVALFLILRYKHITLESFIYFRNRKIIPFFKPVVFGPLSIDVDDEKVKKAEFYVNGQLKDTLTEAPYVWRWNEGAFMKKIIETKVYDEEGNEHSSEGMTFYVFNSPKLFK